MTTTPVTPPRRSRGPGALPPPRQKGRAFGAILRAVDYGTSCVVEAEVFPVGSHDSVRPGPYTFADAAQATAFVTEAVESLCISAATSTPNSSASVAFKTV